MKLPAIFSLLVALESCKALRNIFSHHAPSSSSLKTTFQSYINDNLALVPQKIHYESIGTSKTALQMKTNSDKDSSDEKLEKVTYLKEDKLRAFWLKSGMSAASYNEGAALSKLLLSDEDDDDDDFDDYDDDDDDGIKEALKGVPNRINRQRFLRKKTSGTSSDGGVIVPCNAGKSVVTATDKKKLFKKFMTRKRAESIDDQKITETSSAVNLDSSGLPIPAGRSVGK